MYKKLTIKFGRRKEIICSVGPFTSKESWDNWIDWCQTLISGTKISVSWEDVAEPIQPLYSAMSTAGTVIQRQHALVH